ncbi:hypothetical protein L873DRAFT_311322 [Choiromyces venosus 120613-1]|uniref:Uncharacterized protein n=1 Tax=Choiromyces venosus 120613-1 TaxID=1336337 RepID=A0A3N4JC76_9PEZI|nr:hypothetical protein L873DRAFT_311322 [Choiromyces venosus 120613-1]
MLDRQHKHTSNAYSRPRVQEFVHDDRNASQSGETLVKHHHNCIVDTAHETLVKHLERWPNRYIFTFDSNVFCGGIVRRCLVS